MARFPDRTGKRIAFYTLGCKVNRYETQMLAERFTALGFEVVPPAEGADIYVINSCTVTAVADRKSRNFARRSKRMNPDALTVLAGCYAQTAAGILDDMPEVDMLVGSADKERLPELLAGRASGCGEAASGREGGVTGLSGRARAYIKIEDGCDRFCSFCVVPRARGGVRSRPLADIETEARALVANGYREIVFTGVNAALYGSDRGLGILDAVDAVSRIGGDFRIRLSSLEPTVIDAAYAGELVKRERLCPDFHLSLQSGSDAVLSAMKRGYSMGDYLRIVDVLKKHDPLFSVTTDLIAGFPGETETDHGASLNAVREIGFSRIHVFRYSRRPGTPAAGMDGQIPSAVKAERSRALIVAGKKSAESFLEKNIGSRRRVLFYGGPEREAPGEGVAGEGADCERADGRGVSVGRANGRGVSGDGANSETPAVAPPRPKGTTAEGAQPARGRPSAGETYRGITDNGVEVRMGSDRDLSNSFAEIVLDRGALS